MEEEKQEEEKDKKNDQDTINIVSKLIELIDGITIEEFQYEE